MRGSVGVGWRLVLDVVTSEAATLPVISRPPVLPYSDIADDDIAIPTTDLREILANKWLMLDDRDEPRDLFDLWWGIGREGIPFGAITEACATRYGYTPMPASIEKARRLERAWTQRLGYQLADLPSFGDVLSTIERAFDAWRASVSR